MAIKPTKPTVPPAPSRSNPGVDFSNKADVFAAFQSPFADYMDEIADFVDQMADDALAAATGGDLPPLTGQAGKVLAVKGDESGAEFVPMGDQDNRIINGAFDFWQRGTSFGGNAYGADRWYNNGSGGTVTQSRQAFTVGDTLGSNSPTFFLRQSISGQTLSSHQASIIQGIEGVRSYAAQTITVLGWARRSSGTGNMAVEAVQYFGTGGTPSSTVTGISPTTVTLTGSWAAFAVTITVPSITGKTLGTNNNDYLGLNFWSSAGSDFNARTNSLGLQTIGVDLWGVHIKVGTHTTAATDLYKQPELGPEFNRCLRYYERFGPGKYIGIGMAWEANAARVVLTYYPKRGTPSFTSNEVVAYKAGSTGVIITSPSFDLPTSTTTILYGSSSMSATAGQAIQVVTNGPSGFITVDAEL